METPSLGLLSLLETRISRYMVSLCTYGKKLIGCLPINDLPEGRVGICQLRTHQVSSFAFRVALECALKKSKEFWDSVLAEVRSLSQRFFLLVFIILSSISDKNLSEARVVLTRPTATG